MESNHPQQQQNEDLGKPAAVLPHDTSLETSATHTKTTTSEPFPCHAPPPPQIALKTKTAEETYDEIAAAVLEEEEQEVVGNHLSTTTPHVRRTSSSAYGRASLQKPHMLKDAHGSTKIFGSALGLLTRKFMDILMASDSGVADMGICARILGIPKRRVYDITNVLEGVGMIEKRSKNTVAWKGSEAILGPTIDPNAKASIDELRADIDMMRKEEEKLEQYLEYMNRNQAVLQTVSTDQIIQGIFYPTGGGVEKVPTKNTVLDETGKPKCALIAVQAPFGSFAHLVPSTDGGPERRLYVGNAAGLARYSVTPPTQASPLKRQSPFALTSGRVFKTARSDERDLSVYVLPTFFDDKEQKLKTTGLRPLSDDPPRMFPTEAEDDNTTPVAYKVNDDSTGEELASLQATAPSGAAAPVNEGETKRLRSTSWDVTASMAHDDQVSALFEV